MNKLKPEDVRKALAWYEVVGKNIGSVTIPYNELQAIAAQFREKDSEIEMLTAQIEHCDACDRIGLTHTEHMYCIKQAKSEAITEFAERLKGRFNLCDNAMYSETTVHSVITKVVKEMEGTLRENNDC